MRLGHIRERQHLFDDRLQHTLFKVWPNVVEYVGALLECNHVPRDTMLPAQPLRVFHLQRVLAQHDHHACATRHDLV